MTVAQLATLARRMDEHLERIVRQAVKDKRITRKEDEVFIDGESLDVLRADVIRLLDRIEAEKWERLQEKV